MSRPDKYRRVGNAPIDSLDSNSQQTLFTQQKFQRDVYTTLGLTVLTPGVLFKFPLPGTVTKHRFWIAAGACFQNVTADVFYILGRLNFYRSNRPVGSYEFSGAGQRAASTGAVGGSARRSVTQELVDGSGPLPAIRYSVYNSADYPTAYLYQLDIPCTEIEILADRVEYELEEGAVGLTDAVNSITFILTGCRIVSTA